MARNSACTACGGNHPAAKCPREVVNWDDATGLALVPATGELSPGNMVGEYQLSQQIGSGGMGVVWAAVHPLIGRKAAIKIMHVSASGVAARFLKEAQATSRIRHRNIVDVFSFGQLPDGRSYLIMEFLEGQSLAAHLSGAGLLPFDRARPILDGVLAGLRVSHEKGIIHRDLKPENIWLCPDEDGAEGSWLVKLLDFGLAKLVDQPDGADSRITRVGTPLGTPSYMSPEQCRGVQEIDHRSDIYSVGVIMFQLFAGRLPFVGESHIDVINQHLQAAPPSLTRAVGAPRGLEAVVLRALAKRPEDRFQTVVELREALHQCGAAGFVPATGGSLESDLTPQAWSEYVPSTPIAPMAGTAPGPANGSPLADPILLGDLTMQPELDGETLTLSFQGELDSDDAAPALKRYFDDLTAALHDRVRRVVLDLEGLHFLNTATLTCFAQWLLTLRDLREQGLAPATIRYTNAVRWQVATTAALHRADPALMLEAAD